MSESAVTRAEVALAAYRDVNVGCSYEELIADLLADLMHIVDALRLDREIGDDVLFEDLLDTAVVNYTAEIEEGKA